MTVTLACVGEGKEKLFGANTGDWSGKLGRGCPPSPYTRVLFFFFGFSLFLAKETF